VCKRVGGYFCEEKWLYIKLVPSSIRNKFLMLANTVECQWVVHVFLVDSGYWRLKDI
jgi:hypothetical protein